MRFFFFDLDGTLEDSRDDMADSVNAVRKHLSLQPREIEILKKHVNKGMHELYMNCFDDYFQNKDQFDFLYDQVKTKYEDHYLKNICIKTKCYSEIEVVLKTLALKDKIFVITNKPELHSRELLKKLGLYKYITDVMGGDSCAEMKPSSLPLKIVSKRHNFCFESDKAFMVGDSAGDIKAGNSFGATTVWCSWGYQKDPGSDFPKITVNTPIEILNII